jgi:acyl carrier protein
VTAGTLKARITTPRDVEEWLIGYLAPLLKIDRDQIDRRRPFAEYGLDSLAAVTLSGELERWLGRELSPTLAWDYPTIESLARHLADQR